MVSMSAMTTDARAIGLFDSGIGGLTVLKSLLQAFPNENFVYLGDTARLPYGSKSPETIERYCLQNIEFLKARGVKAIVVACNTASTVLLTRPRDFGIPVYNVIEPGADAAIKSSNGGRIGVLGTKATVQSKSYVRAIHSLKNDATVFQMACPLLVPLVEEGWEDDPLTNLVIYRYLQPLIEAKIDTLILGCTHYPALRNAIAKVAGPNVELVDSSLAIAELIKRDISALRFLPNPGLLRQAPEFLTTDVATSFLEVARRLLTPFEVPDLIAVDIGTLGPPSG